MKKTVYFVLAAATFYLSAMYQSMPLIMLSLAEILLAAGMWILSRYLKRRLTVTLPEQNIVTEKRAEYWCCCEIHNRGRLPASRYRLCIKLRYPQERWGTVRFLYGASGPGTDRIRFGVHAPYCGMVRLNFDRLRVYDYLALFSGRNVLRQEMRISILPSERPLWIDASALRRGSGNTGQGKTVPQSGDPAGGIRQLREYQPGDPYRHIHWNQSARTDRIWIKEYETEASPCVDFLLEIKTAHGKKPREMDAFYRLLYSILLGLLQRADGVKISWYDGHPDRLAEMEIRDEGQCRELFLQLYQMDFLGRKETAEKELLESYALSHDRYFKLDSGLCWYLDQSLIYHFSGENLEQEIINKTFAL